MNNGKLTKKKYDEVRRLWFTSDKRQANQVLQCNYNQDKTVYDWQIGFLDIGHHTNYIHKFVGVSKKFTYEEIKEYLINNHQN